MFVTLIGVALLALALAATFRPTLAQVCRVAAAIVLLALVAEPALAAGETTVTIPWGDWLAQIVNQLMAPIGLLIAGVITVLCRNLPASMVNIIRTMQADQLLTKAVDYGLNATAGAAKGQALTVDVGNSVVATAAKYAIENGAPWLLNWIGGADGIAEKIIARLNLEPAAAVTGGVITKAS